ncbi:MAG: PilZ domain-containing protein [Rhizomicrobium sp.]
MQGGRPVAGGASIESDYIPEAGTHIVLYVDGFGRFEGAVARPRRLRLRHAVQRDPAQAREDRRTAHLFLNKSLVDDGDMRAHDRTPTKGVAQFTRTDGTIVKCEVIDLSPTGVSVKTAIRPHIGEFVLIGQLAGRVARHHADGIGIQFVGLTSEKPTTDQLHASIAAPR